MHLNQSLGGWGAELKASSSNSLMNRFEIRRLMGNPWLYHRPVQKTFPGRGGRYFKAKLQQGDYLLD